MNVKITKRKLWHELNCDKCHNYYFAYWGRIYNDENTKYKRFSFIVFFDAFELQEYYSEREDEITNKDIQEYADVLADSFIAIIKSYDDCKDFYDMCNCSIESYNKICV
jgi:hypothetical protein